MLGKTHLQASGGAAGDNFGASVSISGAAFAVGAISLDVSSGTNSGSVYVYFLSQDECWIPAICNDERHQRNQIIALRDTIIMLSRIEADSHTFF